MLHHVIRTLSLFLFCLSLNSAASASSLQIIPVTAHESLQNQDITLDVRDKNLITMTDLSLYHFLEFMRTAALSVHASMLTSTAKPEKTSSQLKSIAFIVSVLEEENVLLDKIIKTLNNDKSDYLDLTYKFVNLCNFFDPIEEIRLRDIRMFQQQVKDFEKYTDKFITKLSRTQRTSATTRELVNNIKKFTRYLTSGLPMWDQFLHYDFLDRVEDACIYRPIELICKHPMISITIALLIAAGIGYYYLSPVIEKWMLTNNNAHLDVTQLGALRQSGLECSIHSLYNVRCMMNGNNEAERVALLNDQAAFNAFRNQCIAFRGGVHRIQMLDAIEARELAEHFAIPLNNFTIVPDIGALASAATWVPVLEPAGDDLSLLQRINRFQTGTPQYFAVNTAHGTGSIAANGSWVAPRGGHWIAYRFDHDAAAHGGMRVTAVNSTLGNITNHQAVNNIAAVLGS